MSNWLNQRQRCSFAILIIAVLQKATAFVQLCKFRILVNKVLNGELCITLTIPFIEGTVISNVVKSCTVGFDQAVAERTAKRFEDLTLALSRYQGNSFLHTVSY